ncbi:MAG: DUF4280 domain-containing protein [Cellulomonas sp.]|uniref:DUF4280 domain-containing protein n=1 Tax=Cellulomonas sp. TaxID=40001 RepID=UPI001A05EC36|nr:DUF4280 domain-containing protein [Cellulomonas sp.]MBF0687297.1 DUF4280 domain-containing protein [Cellulomonas sp.]
MPVPVTASATVSCSFGTAPATLVALPTPRVLVEGRPVATVTDAAPLVNVATFAMCTSLANPQVAAATAAALGVLTPMPCVPATTGTWTPTAPRTVVGGRPVLAQGAVCMCAFGGVVQVVVPGPVRTTVA